MIDKGVGRFTRFHQTVDLPFDSRNGRYSPEQSWNRHLDRKVLEMMISSCSYPLELPQIRERLVQVKDRITGALTSIATWSSSPILK